jgi:acid phosphatase type 7
MRTILLAAATMLASPVLAQAPATPPPVLRTPGTPYAPRSIPDRIVLTAGADPARVMAVAFRTDRAQMTAEAQIALAVDGPTIEREARTVTGTTTSIDSANGPANYHQVRFAGLEPDRVYAYRVKGAAGWSEWFQFRTAATTFKPFRFLYLGDTQNGILTYASRVIRQGFAEGRIALTVHAGDLAAQRDDLDHDDEWGEWNQAGGYNYSQIPQLPATGNHEFVDVTLPGGAESRKLGPYWPLQFALPSNGADGVKATTYYVDYQGVRFIILDGTSALDLGALDSQTRWLDATLAASPATWNVVLFHQPIFTCARPNDTEVLKRAWKPIFDKRRVDLVLQGHDHCYSRLTAPAGRATGKAARARGDAQGPVYLVSVTGSKMYGLNDRARTQPDRVAEATELFQTVDVEEQRLRFRTYTASGLLYDGFDLTRGNDGRNYLAELPDKLPAVRTCTDAVGPDGGACVARGK